MVNLLCKNGESRIGLFSGREKRRERKGKEDEHVEGIGADDEEGRGEHEESAWEMHLSREREISFDVGMMMIL